LKLQNLLDTRILQTTLYYEDLVGISLDIHKDGNHLKSYFPCSLEVRFTVEPPD